MSARGFGLTEVMVSATMLAVGMTAAITTIQNLESSYAHERLVTQALNIAEQTMEGLLVRYSTDPALSSGSTHAGTSYTAAGKAGGSFFTTEWVVNDAVPIVDTRELVVTVRWTERSVAKALTLRTVRT